MTPRQEFEAWWLDFIGRFTDDDFNVKRYQARFARWSDAEFDAWVTACERGECFPDIVVPNFSKSTLTVERNFEIADWLGHSFHERLWLDEGNDIPPYLSNPSYLVMDLPLRRQAQHLVKKISIPKHNRSIDEFSGQVTGASKGSKLSYPETQILAAKQLDWVITESLKYRGGDLKGFNVMNSMIAKTGSVSLDAIEPYSGVVRSTETLATLLTMMHIDNTLLGSTKQG